MILLCGMLYLIYGFVDMAADRWGAYLWLPLGLFMVFI